MYPHQSVPREGHTAGVQVTVTARLPSEKKTLLAQVETCGGVIDWLLLFTPVLNPCVRVFWGHDRNLAQARAHCVRAHVTMLV